MHKIEALWTMCIYEETKSITLAWNLQTLQRNQENDVASEKVSKC